LAKEDENSAAMKEAMELLCANDCEEFWSDDHQMYMLKNTFTGYVRPHLTNAEEDTLDKM